MLLNNNNNEGGNKWFKMSIKVGIILYYLLLGRRGVGDARM